jgi:1-acyl-sn-glycerol-3-phosphate acyltransferase
MNVSVNPFVNLTKHRPEFDDRYRGEQDEFGFNLDTFCDWEPIFRFFYDDYFSVQTIGMENIPANGRAVLAGNHSGGLPIDAFMTSMAIYNLHPHPRRVRFLSLDCLRKLPLLGGVLTSMGAVPATFATAQKLLENDELVFFYPEGPRGTGKRFSMRYRLHNFDPGFIKAAILTGSPVIPVTVVGGDEIYPLLGDLPQIARLINVPYYPITPTFPWLPPPASFVPTPIRMLIKFGKPIHLDYPPERAHDHKLRIRLTREIQYQIQREINELLRLRHTPFTGWEEKTLAKLTMGSSF